MAPRVDLNFNEAEQAAWRRNKAKPTPVKKRKRLVVDLPWSKITVTGLPAFESREVEEGIWEQVQRRREEGHRLMRGGQYREPDLYLNESLHGGQSGKGTIKKGNRTW